MLMVTIVQAQGGLPLNWLPTYDLLALPILVASVNGTWRTPWIFFVAILAFIVGDFLLQPHALITAAGASSFDDIAHETTLVALWGMINRPIGLCLAATIAGSISAYSVERAIRRAERAEEIAALEHTMAEQKRQLEVGIQQILQTHVQVANGDYGARAPLSQDNVLWQIANSLNNLLNRLQRARQVGQPMRRADPPQPRGGYPGDDQRNNWREPMPPMSPQEPSPWPNAAQPQPAPGWPDSLSPAPHPAEQEYGAGWPGSWYAPQPGQQNGGQNGG